MSKMNKDPTKVLRILIKTMVLLPDMALIQEAEDALFQLSASFPRYDLNKRNSLFNRLLNRTIELLLDHIPFVIKGMQIQLDLRHNQG
jgi:hypothetical protein